MLTNALNAISSSLMQTYNRAPIQLVKGKGSFVWDQNGVKYLDFTSGIATCNLGHVPESVKQALIQQLDQLWHCSNLYQIGTQEQLATLLTVNSCFDQVFFCNSGAEANEAAIKLVRIYANNGNSKNSTIVTFKQSFHGRTLATLTATGQEKVQKGFSPLIPGFQYLPYNDLEALDQLINIQPCAVMLEMIQGEGGVISANQEWVQKLVSICHKQSILLIVDEVQTGLARTGTLFAYEHYQFEPDIMTLAKGLGSGFPIGAMLAKNEVAKAFVPGTHGSTFGGNPLAATAGLATLETIFSTNLLSTIQEKINRLWSKLKEVKQKHSLVKEIRGKGLLIGIVLEKEANQLVELARQEHLLILTAGPNVIRILPPLTVNDDEINQFFDIFNRILSEVEEL
ncbi:acetylornithine aminotransferase [Heyndrickxia sporothermodurans]|nr:acetylornithine aminotransferase [Heyndrickxia sporothermodurans]